MSPSLFAAAPSRSLPFCEGAGLVSGLVLASDPDSWIVAGPSVQAAPTRDDAALPSLAGRRVLLVEDEMMLALDLQIALEDQGACVLGPIDDVASGLALLDEEAPLDLAILDVDLHGEAVFPIAERLEARGTAFLFHTGHGSREALKARFASVPVCIKPVLAEDLIDQLRRLLA